jgi:hypothetical protein
MQNSDIQALCERRFLQLVEDYGLPQPDAVEVVDGCVKFVWHDQKVIVDINLADFIDRDAKETFDREHFAA